MRRPLPSAVQGALRSVREAAGALRERSGPSGVPEPDNVGARPKKRLSLLRAAGACAWEVQDGMAELLRDVDEVLLHRRPPRVAVLGGASGDWSALVKTAYPNASVTVLDVHALAPSALHARLAAQGRFDAIVSDTGGGVDDLPRLQRTFFHLRPDGALFIKRYSATERATKADRTIADPWALVEAAMSSCDSGEPRTRADMDRRAMSAAISKISIGTSHLALVNSTRAFAKLHEDEMDTVLEARGESAGSVLVTLPAQEFVSRCTLRENVDERDALMPERYSVPPMSLREYRDVVCMPRQIVLQRNVILPDSFRHNAAPRLHHSVLQDVDPGFAQLGKAPPRHPERLEGSYFYLDSEYPAHFGHAMTEQLSRLWALADARRAAPDLKAVLSRKRADSGLTEFEREIFAAAGLPESDVVLHHRPVRVDRLLAASPMFAMPRHVHPDLREVWHDLGSRLASAAPDRAYPRRFFCSRRGARRLCHNLGEVEQFFEARGFAVVYPEELPFVEQVRMFREAEVIGGFAGSALFTTSFCPSPRRVIVLGPRSYLARNEYMICAVAGHRLDYVWSEPDPVEASGPKPRYAGFRFDFEQEGRYLEEILASL